MPAITASMVAELRAKTDAPMMECKKALTEADGDLGRAEEILQLRKPFVDGGQWLEESEIHLSFGKFWGREGPFNPRRRRIEMPCTSLAGLDEVAQMPPAFLQQGVHRATPSGSARATTSF